MSKDLSSWKSFLVEDAIAKAKQFMREGKELKETILTEEQLIEVQQEVEIEDFYEEVDFDGELDLTEEFICEETGVMTVYDFVPCEDGVATELTFEIAEEYLVEEKLEMIQELLMAKEYEVIEEAGSNKGAKVVFKRAKGKITKSKRCGKGFRLKGNRCIPQTGGQKAANRLKGIRLKRAKRAMGAGKKKRAALKAKLTKKRIKSRARNYAGTTN